MTKLKLVNIRIVVCIFGLSFFTSCTKDKKACWDLWDVLSLQPVSSTPVCDKTKEEAETINPNFIVSKKGEKRYCWVTANNLRYTCVPESIMKRVFDRVNISFTKEGCSTTCP
jgi:hypothetical protein